MRYILSLVLTICLCGSALAGDNPFAQVIEDEEARIAAVLVDREKANAAAELLLRGGLSLGRGQPLLAAACPGALSLCGPAEG